MVDRMVVRSAGRLVDRPVAISEGSCSSEVRLLDGDAGSAVVSLDNGPMSASGYAPGSLRRDAKTFG